MWPIVTLIAALSVGSAPGKQRPNKRVEAAIRHLSGCTSVRDHGCLDAAATLGNSGDAALPPLGRAIPEMTRAGQLLAVSVLASSDSRRALTPLIKVARSRKVPAVIRSVAVANLGTRKGKPVVRALFACLKDRDHVVRAASARALGTRSHYNDPKILRALARAAEDTNPEVRVEALLGLGLAGADVGGPVLQAALSDRVPKVRHAAAEGLLFVKFAPAIGPLIVGLRSQDKELRVRNAKALRFQTGLNYGEDYAVWTEWYRHWQR